MASLLMWAWLVFRVSTAYATTAFPYIPATILSAPSDKNKIYVFQSGQSGSPGVSLISLNTDATITSLDVSGTLVTTSFPFFNEGISYVPLMDSRGNINVFAGHCEAGANGSSLWILTNGTWAEASMKLDGIDASSTTGGPKYLSAGISFSTKMNGSASFYIFGGMCPNSTSSTALDWQSAADYDNTMVSLQSRGVGLTTSADFYLGVVSARGPPIPEAGFTMTPLQPSYFNSSDGNTSQQQNYVLLGGQTQLAFINMSQVALFSLPQRSWVFLPVETPLTAVKTDLAARDISTVDPRSGHTAVLTDDGRHIVLFGGWVGDISTPAHPQLAILELGDGYGGAGSWKWNIPAQPDTGSSGEPFLYGHAAVMLPGGVMMVVGGYSISKNGGNALQAADLPITNTRTFFFNVTANAWLSAYTNPIITTNVNETSNQAEANQASIKQIGLGVGLGFGLAAIIGIIVLYVCYYRRKERQRIAREKHIQDLSLDAHRLHDPTLGFGGIDGRGGQNSAVEFLGRRQPDSFPWAPDSGSSGDGAGIRTIRSTAAERTGLLVEIPSPTRGLRKSLRTRSTYQPTSRPTSNIHPIDERDEYEEGLYGRYTVGDAQMYQRPSTSIFASAPQFDPFRDEVSRSPSPESPARERDREVQAWISDWSAADSRMQQQAGRASPDKSERTSSTLSDQSAVSALSNPYSVGSMSRSISQRSVALLRSNPFSTTNNALIPNPPSVASNVLVPRPTIHRRSQSLTLRNPFSGSVDATVTSHRLQRERQNLLDRPHTSETVSNNRTQGRATGWMGSVRRALMGGDRGPSNTLDTGERTSSSSPTRPNYGYAEVPRRAASTGTMLWKKRQGAKDWDVENEAEGSSAKGGAINSADADDEEWDVESAVERRVVQVMFTVPKEKLRIVNGGPEGDGDSIVTNERDVPEANDESEDHGKGKGKGKAKL